MYEIITAVQNENGKWVLKAKTSGEFVEEGYEHDTKARALADAKILYPANSVWCGHEVRGGWKIKVD